MRQAASDDRPVRRPALIGLPFTNAEDLMEWGKRLALDNSQRDDVIRFYRQLGGSRASSMVNSIIASTMTNSLTTEFSLRGHKRLDSQKRSFSALQILPII